MRLWALPAGATPGGRQPVDVERPGQYFSATTLDSAPCACAHGTCGHHMQARVEGRQPKGVGCPGHYPKATTLYPRAQAPTAPVRAACRRAWKDASPMMLSAQGTTRGSPLRSARLISRSCARPPQPSEVPLPHRPGSRPVSTDDTPSHVCAVTAGHPAAPWKALEVRLCSQMAQNAIRGAHARALKAARDHEAGPWQQRHALFQQLGRLPCRLSLPRSSRRRLHGVSPRMNTTLRYEVDEVAQHKRQKADSPTVNSESELLPFGSANPSSYAVLSACVRGRHEAAVDGLGGTSQQPMSLKTSPGGPHGQPQQAIQIPRSAPDPSPLIM